MKLEAEYQKKIMPKTTPGEEAAADTTPLHQCNICAWNTPLHPQPIAKGATTLVSKICSTRRPPSCSFLEQILICRAQTVKDTVRLIFWVLLGEEKDA